MIKDERRKILLSIFAVFSAGAIIVNAIWVYSYNTIDARHVQQINETIELYDNRITKIHASHRREMGAMRNRVEKKVDAVLEKLEKMPPSPIVIDARREIESVRNGG